jgi:hypothetical protein
MTFVGPCIERIVFKRVDFTSQTAYLRRMYEFFQKQECRIYVFD